MANYVEQLSFTPYVNPYVKGPVEEYKELQTELRNRYDTVSSKYDALKSEAQKMAALEPDENKKKAIIDEVNNQFKQAVEAGDFENRDRIVNQAILKFQKDYAPVAQQVKAYQDRKAYYDERVKNKTLNPEKAQQALKYEMDMYSKQRENGESGFEYDPETGEARKGFSSYAKDRANDFDVNKHILEVIKPKLDHPMKEGTQIIKENGRYVYTTETGRKKVLKPELQKLIFDSFKTNDDWQAYEKDKAFYDTYNLDDNQLNQEKLNIINKEAELLQAREITDNLLNKTTEAYKKQGVKNAREKALIDLRSQGYLDSKFVKDRINGLVNSDAKSLLINNLINRNVSEAAGFASDYAYKETEYKEDFKAWTKEHEAEVANKLDNLNNTWNNIGTTTYEEYAPLVQKRQEAATKLANESTKNWLTLHNNFKKDNQLSENFNTVTFAKKLNNLKANSNLSPDEFKKQALQLLKDNGIKGDLQTVIQDASDILDSYNQAKKGQNELKNINNINNKIYEIIETKSINDNSNVVFINLRNFSEAANKYFEKNNIKSAKDLAVYITNNKDNSKVKDELDKLIHFANLSNKPSSGRTSIETQTGMVNEALKNLQKETSQQLEAKRKNIGDVINTGFTLSNPNEKSVVGGLNKTVKEGLEGSLENQIVSGTDNFDVNSYLKGVAEQKGYEIKSYKLDNAEVYSTSDLGNKKVRARIIVTDSSGKEKVEYVDLSTKNNEDLINRNILNAYKNNSLPKQSNLLIEQGYYNENIENPEDLDMLEKGDFKQVVIRGSGDYTVIKQPNGWFTLKQPNNPNLNEAYKSLDEIKQVIGRFETVNQLRKLN